MRKGQSKPDNKQDYGFEGCETLTGKARYLCSGETLAGGGDEQSGRSQLSCWLRVRELLARWGAGKNLWENRESHRIHRHEGGATPGAEEAFGESTYFR